MALFKQADRLLSLTTPLGEDVLLLAGFSGGEALSRLFSYQLDLLSEEEAVAARDLVGKNVTWRVQYVGGEPRYFNGYVSRFAASSTLLRHMRAYRAEVVPWLWFLTRAADCRIFQNKTAPEIIEAVFSAFGFSAYELALRQSYPKREYCVQYRETAFNFVSRLLEQEGIFYFFRHEEGAHTLVLADQAGAYADCPEKEVEYAATRRGPGLVTTWDHQYSFRSGKWAQTDYNFETPSTNLLTTSQTLIDLPGVEKYELFDYPGDYRLTGDGRAGTQVRMEEEEVTYDVVSGSGGCTTFSPGTKFTLTKHGVAAEEGKAYVLTAVQHVARDASYGGSARGGEYSNSFTCIPAAVLFRPARLTIKPVVQGPQTAVVVGPSGEEIYTDKYGRVKVQFFWDRQGKKDENSSCWIRVAQHWAGKNWGVVFNPRIGQEVVVDFLEGDPDRPLIIGRVYNAEQMPPYELPANQTQTVLKTRSSKGGSADNFNELRFEDKKGSEDITFHAEKDFHRVVENNDDLQVGNDQTITITNNRTETVQQGNEQITIKQGNRDVVIEMGNESLTLKMGDQTTKLELGKSATEALQSIELKVGQSSVKLDQTGVTIQGLMITLDGQIQTQVKGTMTQVNGSAMLQLQGGVTMIG